MDHHVARAESRERASTLRGDAQPAEHAFRRGTRLPTEIAFLARYGAPAGALLLAMIEAAKCDASCDQALLGEGLMRDEVFYRLLADHLNAPFYSGEIDVDENVDAARAVWSGVAPLAPNDRGLRHLVAPRGAAITLLLRAAQRAGVPDGIAIASPQRFGAATRAAAARSIAHSGAFDLKTYDAELTAHSRLTTAQSATAIASALASLALWALNPDWLGLACWVGLFIVFASSIGLRLAAVAARSRSASIEPIADANLPIYSIVAPLYREANMVDQLVAAFDAIDYPALASKLS